MEFSLMKADLGFSFSISGFHVTAQLSDSPELKGQSCSHPCAQALSTLNNPDSGSQAERRQVLYKLKKNPKPTKLFAKLPPTAQCKQSTGTRAAADLSSTKPLHGTALSVL